MQRCRLTATATVRRSEGFGKRGGLVMRCTAVRCCPRRCRNRREAYGLHPALLDAALHVSGALDAGRRPPRRSAAVAVRVVGGVAACDVVREELRVRASVERGGDGEALAQLQLADGSGRAVARIGGLRLREASEAQIREAARSEAQHLYRLSWRPVGVERGRAGSAATTLIVGGDGELARTSGLDLRRQRARPARGAPGRAAQGVTGADWCSIISRSRDRRSILAATHADAERAR